MEKTQRKTGAVDAGLGDTNCWSIWEARLWRVGVLVGVIGAAALFLAAAFDLREAEHLKNYVERLSTAGRDDAGIWRIQVEYAAGSFRADELRQLAKFKAALGGVLLAMPMALRACVRAARYVWIGAR